MKKENKITVMVISASRPKLVPFLMNSFDKNVIYKGEYDKIWHEDFVFFKESMEVLNRIECWADKIICDRPPVLPGMAIDNILKHHITTDYIFNLEDDWEFELPIDLNEMIDIMDEYPKINCIFFNKNKNIENYHGFIREEVLFNDTVFCTNNQWPFLPGIWRTDFVKRNWLIGPKDKPQEGFFNDYLKLTDKSVKGVYVYGKIDYPRVVRHNGYTWAVKPWGDSPIEKETGYGGDVRQDYINKDRASWLPKEQPRPQYLKNKLKDLEKLKEEGLIKEIPQGNYI